MGHLFLGIMNRFQQPDERNGGDFISVVNDALGLDPIGTSTAMLRSLAR